MESDPKNPSSDSDAQEGNTPPPSSSEPAAIGLPPVLPGAPTPPLPQEPNSGSSGGRKLIAILLSLFLGLFLADAVASLVAGSLIILFDKDALSAISGVLSFFSSLLAILIYGLMGLTRAIPKRFFLPLTLFYLVSSLVVVPFMIYSYGHLAPVDWGLSLCQLLLGLAILWWVKGGLNFRWPLVAAERLEVRGFGWGNLLGFLSLNAFVLTPAVIVYLIICAGMAANHFSEGFLVLRPVGLTVRVRKYVRNDGKTIQLFPMIHVAESEFYQKVLQSFPTNSVVLMEGVSDEKNLITNKVTYKRMAKALNLGEQHEAFKPSRGETVRADVDVGEFATNTIDVLNLAMLIHSKGLNLGTLMALTQFKEPPDLQDQLINDLLKKRNKHLLEVIQSELARSEHIIVPWGAAHMPELAREIQKSGFHLETSEDYVAIRFHSAASEHAYEKAQ